MQNIALKNTSVDSALSRDNHIKSRKKKNLISITVDPDRCVNIIRCLSSGSVMRSNSREHFNFSLARNPL